MNERINALFVFVYIFLDSFISSLCALYDCYSIEEYTCFKNVYTFPIHGDIFFNSSLLGSKPNNKLSGIMKHGESEKSTFCSCNL